MNLLWGIDLGGTKTEGIIVDADKQFETLFRMRLPTDRDKGYEHVLALIGKLIAQMEQETGQHPKRIGIGTPGTLDPATQTMKNCNTECLNGQPLKQDLQSQLKLPFEIANDANCFALAEAKLGIVQDYFPNAEVVFGVIMGTGVGGGVVVNGKIIHGAHGIGGEWGHNFLDESGGPCYCGRSGCVETVISGTACEQYYEKISGQFLKLKEIVNRHKAGTDKYATETISRLIHFFGKGLAPIINIIDPTAIVLGGGVGNIDLLYTEGRKEIEKYLFNNEMNTLILKPKLGDSAGVFGAAMLVAD